MLDIATEHDNTHIIFLSFTSVSVGSTIGDSTEVLSGVSAGDRVVVDAPQTLKDGDKVKVQ